MSKTKTEVIQRFAWHPVKIDDRWVWWKYFIEVREWYMGYKYDDVAGAQPIDKYRVLHREDATSFLKYLLG